MLLSADLSPRKHNQHHVTEEASEEPMIYDPVLELIRDLASLMIQ